MGGQEKTHLNLNGTFPGTRTQANFLILFLFFRLIWRCIWDSYFSVSRLQPWASVLWIRGLLATANSGDPLISLWVPSEDDTWYVLTPWLYLIWVPVNWGMRVCLAKERWNRLKTISSSLGTFLGSSQTPPEIADADSLALGTHLLWPSFSWHLIVTSQISKVAWQCNSPPLGFFTLAYLHSNFKLSERAQMVLRLSI